MGRGRSVHLDTGIPIDFAKVSFHFHFLETEYLRKCIWKFCPKNGEYWLGNRNLHLLTTQGKVYLIPNSLKYKGNTTAFH